MTFEDGLNFAFAFTSYSGQQGQRIESPSNYTVKAQMRNWKVPENGFEAVYDTIWMYTHPCTEDELGLG